MNPPDFTSLAPEFAAYRPTARMTLPELAERLAEVVAWCRTTPTRRLLADVRGIPDLPMPSTLHRFTLGEQAAGAAQGIEFIGAVVAPPEFIDPSRFGVRVATNRGLTAEIFSDEVTALEWLVGPAAVRPVLETERLQLRWLRRQDAAFIHQLLTQPSWLRFIGDRGVSDIPNAEGYIQNGPRASYKNRGFGLWCVKARESQEPIGMCGLLQRPGFEHPEIGFAFLEAHQGRGYATEAARATVETARTTFGLSTLWAVVDPSNVGSVKILTGLGFRRLRPIAMPGETKEIDLYQLG